MTAIQPATLVARPAAKVNLTLEVGPREANGYHRLRSVFLRLGFADRLAVSVGRTGVDDTLSVDGPPECPVEGNLVLKAVDLLRRRVGQSLPPLVVALEKQIPIGAGLGGGSSDAAAMLALAEVSWGVRASAAERLELAHRLGSDVPFFATDAPAALVEGRGEAVTPLPGVVGGAGLLIAISRASMETGRVFARHDELASDETSRRAASPTDELAAAFRSGLDGRGLAAWPPQLREANDLWAAATSLAPSIARLRLELEKVTGQAWLLTGSGSALLAIYPSSVEAVDAGRGLAGALPAEFHDCQLVADDLLTPDPPWRDP